MQYTDTVPSSGGRFVRLCFCVSRRPRSCSLQLRPVSDQAGNAKVCENLGQIRRLWIESCTTLVETFGIRIGMLFLGIIIGIIIGIISAIIIGIIIGIMTGTIVGTILGLCPKVFKHGLLENPSFIGEVPILQDFHVRWGFPS